MAAQIIAFPSGKTAPGASRKDYAAIAERVAETLQRANSFAERMRQDPHFDFSNVTHQQLVTLYLEARLYGDRAAR